MVSAPLDAETAAAVRAAGFRVQICLDDGGHYSVQESLLWAMNLTEELEIKGGIVFLQVSRRKAEREKQKQKRAPSPRILQ